MSEEIERTKTLRASAKGSITRVKNIIESKRKTLTLPELECRLGILEAYFKQLLSYHSTYETLVPGDNTNSSYRSECEEIYCSTKSLISVLMTSHKRNLQGATDFNQSMVIRSSPYSNLHKVKLPRFSGRYSEYPNFIGIFNKSINGNENYDNIEKCNILVSSLDGIAKNAVREFQISEDNYPKILNHLDKRFNNKSLMFQELISELFQLPKIFKPTASSLRTLVDNANAILSSMLSIGSGEDIANSMIIYIVMNKLDPGSQNKWEESINFSELLKWKDCSEILSKRCQFLECREAKSSPSSSQSSKSTFVTSRNKSSFSNTNSTVLSVSHPSNRKSFLCPICNQLGHSIYKCTTFSKLSVADRFNKIKGLSLCLNCLSKGHSVKSCTSSKCRVCSGAHHTLLHRYDNSTNSFSTITNSQTTPNSHTITNLQTTPNSSSSSNSSLTLSGAQTASHFALLSTNDMEPKADPLKSDISTSNNVILATALIFIKDSSGMSQPVRALLDSGSQLNFVTDRFVQFLGLKKRKLNTHISGIANSNVKINYSTQAIIKSRHNNFITNLDMLVLPSIAGVMPDSPVPVRDWNIPKNINLADPQFYIQQNVDILIGAEVFFELLSVGQIKLGKNMPILQKTLLGWIVSGKYSVNQLPAKHKSLVVSVNEENVDTLQNLHELVKNFWQIESIENKLVKLTEEQALCERFFYSTFRRSPSGRIIVKLPFKRHSSELGSSREIAERRFYSLEKRLNKNFDLKRQYCDFLNEYESLNHMELVPKHEQHLVRYYLPHHCVLKPDSSTTKIRVVFDGSCATTSNISLNDMLMVGPMVQEDLYSIILRFRFHQYALKADISKMYRQFLVDDDDSYYQCILWREDSSKELQTFKLKTVTYGTSAASYLATKALSHLASLHIETCPSGSRALSRDTYVDDLLSGGDSLESIFTIRDQVEKILSSAGMELKKWFSNNSSFLNSIPKSDQEQLININGSSVVKTLGICWQPSTDQFKFCVDQDLFKRGRITKRVVLSDASRLFDPIGFINPIVVKSKIFLQKLWLLKLEWDESLPLALHTEWSEFREDLSLLNQLSIPRFVAYNKSLIRTELHGFCDASAKAYGCCIYLRCMDFDGTIHVNLLTAKSKIAPIRTQSIPRLELCSALLLANLIKRLLELVEIKIDDIILWTDSEIVLAWLSAHPSTWVVFVANRISQIQQITENYTWRHVNSKANAADILSRGANVTELLDSFWFTGPEFLKKGVDQWPAQKSKEILHNVPEKRTTQNAFTTQKISNDLHDTISKFSSYNKIINIFAYIIRFTKNCTTPKAYRQHGTLSCKERNHALLKIIKIIQSIHFYSEINDLQNNKLISPKSILKNFNPFLEIEESVLLLKVGGRLHNASIPHSAKFPIFLPNNSHFVRLLIEHLHVENLHAGPQALLATIRQKYWVTNGKTTVSNIIHKCVRCFKFKPRLAQQVMGNLPKSRVEINRAFLVSGVDFCGPVMISSGIRGKHLTKAHIAVFVCFATHAVHLDLVSSLTSDAFIACLKRFTSRRGLCRELHCDNATNFVGANHILQDLRHKFKEQQFINKISSWCTIHQIEFHHIPPRSPHFGGLWEAAVKSAKFHLNRCSPLIRFTFEEMTTLLTQIESILNSRPLTPLSSDPNDLQVLTPGHFILGGPLNAMPEPVYKPDINISSIKRFNRISAIQQIFWSRWHKEYLSTLQRRNKWCSTSENLKTGTMVLIGEDNIPPQHWLIGIIVKLYPGSDGHIRVVDVKCRNKIFRRQIHALAPLPIMD